MENKIVEIIIDLADSSNAKSFKKENVIHLGALEKVFDFVRDFQYQLTSTRNREDAEKKVGCKKGKNKLTYKHNTITILGTRGSGKTSFLLSIAELVEHDREFEDLLVLDIVDPTLVEEKGHVFLNVISSICEEVKEILGKDECNPNKDISGKKKHWKETLSKLAKGLPAIDGIGIDNFGEWQDAEFVMNNELQAIYSARKLAENFASFIEISLEILEKRHFVLFFDDIDVDSSKGYAVMETIRKYFVSDQLITFLSGDLKLYDALVRNKKWSNFGDKIITYETSVYHQTEGIRTENMRHYNDMVTDLTSQYLIKIMQPKYRVHLDTIYDHYINKYVDIKIKLQNGDKFFYSTIDVFIEAIFNQYGIKGKLQQTTFIEFLFRQPLRSVIHFLQYFRDSYEINNTDFTSVFLSDLYEKHIEINTLKSSTTYLIPTILQTLIQEQKLGESYQLLPSTLDNSFNALLFTSSMLFSNHIKRGNNFLIFEYFFKIAFLRNFVSKDRDFLSLLSIIKSSGLLNDTVFRDSSNQLQCSLYGLFTDRKSVNKIGFLSLYGFSRFAKTSKKESLFRIDYVLDNKKTGSSYSNLQLVFSYMPCLIGQTSERNSTKVFYSIISLLSSIGELSKRFEHGNVNSINFITTITELSQVRYYSMNESDSGQIQITDDEVKKNNLIEDESEDDYEEYSTSNVALSKLEADYEIIFFNRLKEWFDMNLDTISPYLLGKVFTRFYHSLNNIAVDHTLNLGQAFYLQITTFLNAVIIEEARELNINIKFNYNNVVASDKLFLNNISRLNEEDRRHEMKLTTWFLTCPILLMYVKRRVFLQVLAFLKGGDSESKIITNDEFIKSNVISILEKVFLDGSKQEQLKNQYYEEFYQKIKKGKNSEDYLSKYKRINYKAATIENFVNDFKDEVNDLFEEKDFKERDFIKYCVSRDIDDKLDQ